ncbi:hypothetical protein AZ34_01010 [Hylemonella gracilis str. Niagara R]|uniref:Uncharacterized protein n=1 Tax=Hylemonella gracilis str. Niagara R TaxID=1458275 RepID=A0A016XLM4_9BURK|nr:DUF6587 family protein [Hylemonella gracilis]EYC52741.1 hypothetical protein AZ34_01010 [Hylemonella gracilis str. Niagara R]
MQTIVVTLIVFACFAYAAQALMPAALRRALARWLTSWPHWPAPVARRLQRAARRFESGCGCEGCDRPAKAATAVNQPQSIHIQRRRP